jgi:hypothetical protein
LFYKKTQKYYENGYKILFAYVGTKIVNSYRLLIFVDVFMSFISFGLSLVTFSPKVMSMLHYFDFYSIFNFDVLFIHWVPSGALPFDYFLLFDIV